MPQVIHSFRGDKRNPRLKICRGEQKILQQAAWLCGAIQDATVGHHAEIASKAGTLKSALLALASIDEHDLTKPG